MNNFRNTLPLAVALAFGLATLIGLLFVPAVGGTLTGWASLLAAVALLLGILNLLTVHLKRLVGGNIYSAILLLGLSAVIVLAVTDGLGITTDGVTTIFNTLQAPLEAAMASLLAFFLLFSGARMFGRQRSLWAALFILTAIFLLIARAPMPQAISNVFNSISQFVSDIIITPGMRGILIGIALGIIGVSLRILTGSERPYNK